MSLETLAMVPAAPEYEAEVLAMMAEFKAEHPPRYWNAPELLAGDFPAYLRRLRRNALGLDLPYGFVPTTTFWMLRDGADIVGVSSLRHHLVPVLEIEGGHIGYAIRPGERRKGYGTRLLALMLDEARALGLSRALVTCDTDNLGSARIIQKNGGVFEAEAPSPRTGKPVSRYWIQL